MTKILHKAIIGFISAFCTVLVLGSSTILPPKALAQPYPNKPIRFILPFATGGGADIMGRIIAPKLAERLNQPVVPENRAGAGGNIGVEFAAKTQPDGYTLLLGSNTITISPGLYKKLNYDPIKDFTPISMVAQSRLVLFVRSSLPVNSLKELVEYAKANPGKLNFGSSGIGAIPHLSGELLKALAKIKIEHVLYKSAGAALIGLMGGEIDMQVMAPGAAVSGIQTGKVKPLAVLSNERLPSLPNVPTAKEAGIDNYEVNAWWGILAPAGTPQGIITRLSAEWIKIAAMPDTKEKMQKIDCEPISSTPEQFSQFLKTEIVRWAKIIKDANISLD